MKKQFCTAGPIKNDIHYSYNPLLRWNLTEIEELIEYEKYFILHAPRQSGKTTCLLALMEHLNNSGKYKALYINVEAAQAAREDLKLAMPAILNEFSMRLNFHLNDNSFDTKVQEINSRLDPTSMLSAVLTEWAAKSDLPTVLFIDEIDSLIGDTLISVLRQLRSCYDKRPAAFPQSIVLCGVRDVRDYRIHSSAEKTIITGGSAFNIKAESLRLGNFTKDEVRELYLQHTSETGQQFEDDTIEYAWHLTNGQPWLVNALAYEVCFRNKAGKIRTNNITKELLDQAKEELIYRRDTHLDQLIDKLREERVRRVIEPILISQSTEVEFHPDDTQYVVDLGLINQSRNGEIDIANEIYREVIPRELAWVLQPGIGIKQAWYIDANGKLELWKLIEGFQEFFRENSDIWLSKYDYKEAGPQILLSAYLQRIVNGSGTILREYALGRKRTDLLVTWTYAGGTQKIVIELKILRYSPERTLQEGLEQIAEYMDISGTEEGHLIIFDRTTSKNWNEKVFRIKKRTQGKTY